MKLVLGSKSPRRIELLRSINIDFTTRIGNVNESQISTSIPHEKVCMLSELKSKDIKISDEEVLLTADTIVSFSDNIFEKPRDKNVAYEMISTLSGNTHEVYTAFTLRNNERMETFLTKTEVTFHNLDEELIKRYVETEDPYDKAGGYGIQSLGALFVKEIKGDYFAVVGLPISKVAYELEKFGVRHMLSPHIKKSDT